MCERRRSFQFAEALVLNLQDLLAHWRAKIQSNAREWEGRNQSLFNEKVTMNHHYQQLKASMDAFRGALGDRLKQLSHSARTCEVALTLRLSKAETLLKLAERCRKLETEQVRIAWGSGAGCLGARPRQGDRARAA
jgi:dynein regulatory complex subunit 2